MDHDEDAVDLGRIPSSHNAIGIAGSALGRSGAGGGSSVITWDELIRQQMPGDAVFDVLTSGDDSAASDPRNNLLQTLPAESLDLVMSYDGRPVQHCVRSAEVDHACDEPLANLVSRHVQSPLPSRHGVPKGLDEVGSVKRDPAPRGTAALPVHGLDRTDPIVVLPMVCPHGKRIPDRSISSALDDGESSAVDLYATSAVRMPFPLAIDSSVALASIDHKRYRLEATSPDDSALLDVLTPHRAKRSSLTTQGPSSIGDVPPDDENSASNPRIALRSGSTRAWVRGGLVGVLLGVLASFAWHGSGTVGVTSKPDGAIADQLWAHGLRAYRQQDFAAAIQWFAIAEQAIGHDARLAYFSGLARHSLGQVDPAVADFRRGAEFECQSKPNAAEVDRALEAVPHEARLVVSPFRPKR
jgi:hypothetical protein